MIKLKRNEVEWGNLKLLRRTRQKLKVFTTTYGFRSYEEALNWLLDEVNNGFILNERVFETEDVTPSVKTEFEKQN